ncbi:twin-arginine translocase TatA/TatE family subunit [Stomatohabitans albus]|uniref:Sec-independent protein translocase subunit TatA/TatB n=1 Tax=Stomatohabitans albus TaxID=3110766 RepID=UPI00300CA199
MGFQELLVVLAIGLLLFGSKRLPDLAHSLGQSVQLFRQALEEPPLTSRERSRDHGPSHR